MILLTMRLILPNSVRILPNSVRNTSDNLRIDWDGYNQYLEKNFNKHTAKAFVIPIQSNIFKFLSMEMHQILLFCLLIRECTL